MHIDQLETPAVVIDLDKLSANINRLQDYLDEHDIANRPHIKTHKIPEIAHMQVNAGAVGITCQKVGEAEVMAQGGIKDIFIPYNILGASKLERLTNLAKRATISVTADSETTVRGYAEAAQSAGIELPVLVEFDAGTGRCGVQTPQEAADLAVLIAGSPGLRFSGLMTYPNLDAADEFIVEATRLINAQGLTIDNVSGGGTPVMWQAHTHPDITEHRAGTYVYGDRGMVATGAMTLDQCAMRVLCTVVSRPTADRGILDGGSKTFTPDTFGLDGFGYILEYPDAILHKFSEEHGFVDFSACDKRPVVGERISVIPNHCCMVSNMFNQVYGVRNDEVEVVWPVAARGRLQ
jgi:D-serine deaminase-like pyridoxal phosphate-dependent protein